ncbi:MAG TPA: cytochrome P450 [Solirubrobacteraceae bacterium]|jgi:cytochrome P450|nr:cytochrome P450 [Solirubrobacteraceae bacterium]
MAVIQEVVAYVGERTAERRQDPSGDLLTALMDAEVEGDRLTDLELTVFFVLLIAAGNDSTRATYTATMLALMRDPETRRRVTEDPSLIPVAVEEGLRCFPAFAFMGRAATRDVELHGQQISEGDRVLLWYLSSNRDPEVFGDPDRFDIDRPTSIATRRSAPAGGTSAWARRSRGWS